MNEMIEKLAKIIDPVAFGPMSLHVSTRHRGEAIQLATDRAIAVLKALREPSEEMVRAGFLSMPCNAPDRPYSADQAYWGVAFTAMIDAILPQEEKKG